MDTDHEANGTERFPPEGEETNGFDDDDELLDDEEEARDGETEETSQAPVRPRSRPDAGAVGCMALVLAIVLFFGWVIVSAIVDVVKENREAELRRRQNQYSYHSSTKRSSSYGSSSYGSSSYGSSSGGSSSYGSSGSSHKSKSTGGSSRKDEYNAADFGNPEDFYDEHYDDFFDYYDAEDYWNEYN